MSDSQAGRLSSPSSERNLEPIRDALQKILPADGGHLLEIGSGSGYHAAHLAEAMPGWTWIPSDPDPLHRASIRAWAQHLGRPGPDPLALDMEADWSAVVRSATLPPLDAIFCANVVHIAPWEVAVGLFTGAATMLRGDGLLMLYGPFKEGGRHTGDGNARFDADLRAQNPAWGIRALEDLAKLAEAQGFAAPSIHQMPANNRILVFARAAVT
ncbi:MAG: DUF938 domain-containing protein [Pseudomonadota bacterium]